jgi:nitrite transporter NirC
VYREAVLATGELAAAKLQYQRESLIGHLVRSALAGMYVGAAVILILVVGGYVNSAAPHLTKLLMGVCFGGALTIVLFAGSELFTGCNLILMLAVLTGRARWRDLVSNWAWTWLGNLLGCILLAIIVVRSGVLDTEPVHAFVLKVAHTKATLPAEQMLWRGILANWIVCLAVWMNGKMKSESGRLLMIWWCMFTFITCSYEHSVANMTGLLLGILLPQDAGQGITWGEYATNLSVVTVGNMIGGAIFVGGAYWLGSSRPQVATGRRPLAEPKPEHSLV